jgi:hypothetical protein
LKFHIIYPFLITFVLIANPIIAIVSHDLAIPLTPAAWAQTTNSSNKTQQWIDKENNVKIVFSYQPDNPVIGKPTKLLFDIYDLSTGGIIKEALHARVIITNTSDVLKIITSTFPDGNFSINYTFPYSGSYQIISKLDSQNYSELASFNVLLTTQALSSEFYITIMVYYVTPIAASAAGVIVYLSYKKKIK